MHITKRSNYYINFIADSFTGRIIDRLAQDINGDGFNSNFCRTLENDYDEKFNENGATTIELKGDYEDIDEIC